MVSLSLHCVAILLELTNFVARSKTGSGKTAAYLLPILQSILKRKATSILKPSTSALVLVPTKELASQVTKVVQTFGKFCGSDITAVNLTGRGDDKVKRAQLGTGPDIVIASPGAASASLQDGSLVLDQLAHLVIDEADIVLPYNYGDDLETISKTVPKGTQTFLISATLSEDLDTLKGLFCRDPVLLSMDEEEREDASNGNGGVTQYIVKCAEDEKFLLLYAIYKLKLVKGKSIIFVADVDRCYKVKLLLEQFGIKSCVLNSTLPVESRLHVIKEFNQNVYDIIIASDENELIRDETSEKKKKKESKAQENGDQADNQETPVTDGSNGKASQEVAENLDSKNDSAPPKKKQKKQMAQDKNYGISRGLDFQAVAMILNFDLPRTPKSYTHRIGRTGRAGKPGTALSFVIPKSLFRKHKPTSHPICADDEAVLARISASQSKKGADLKPYQFDMRTLEGFRYRLDSALRAVTPKSILAARKRELTDALLKSAKLSRHFEENPAEARTLRHDTELRTAKLQPHLKHVPDYLLPGGAQANAAKAESAGFVGLGLGRESQNRIRRAREKNRLRGKGKGTGLKKLDPLKSLNARGRKKN